ncbi:hypothetical protein BD414DRAFT_217116 [Trametes punicea]|nr:hypothetical protein BD414DRAFT_217116 [Trametes punicea]
MCGRYSLGLPVGYCSYYAYIPCQPMNVATSLQHDEIQQLHGYNVHIGEWVGRDNFVPRHNIAPRSQAPVIRRRDAHGDAAGPSRQRGAPSTSVSAADADPSDARRTRETAPAKASSASAPVQTADLGAPGGSSQGEVPAEGRSELILHTMRWGLVPHYSKHEDGSLKTINARCEALIEGQAGMWASIKGRKRCVVVCEGYYEWLKKGKERLPHFTRHKDGRLMLLAGLWDCAVLKGSTESLWTFTIVTTDASKELSWLHDRQPVILPDEAALETWLETTSGKWTAALSELCAPYRHAERHPLVCYQVPKEVGKIGTESPTFVQPIEHRKDGIQALFAKQTAPSDSSSSQRPKRSASPVETAQDTPAKKRPTVEKVNAWEDDSDVEYVDDPPPEHAAKSTTPSLPASTESTQKRDGHPSAAKGNTGSPRKPSKADGSKSSKRKPKAAEKPDSSAKITSFFGKKH